MGTIHAKGPGVFNHHVGHFLGLKNQQKVLRLEVTVFVLQRVLVTLFDGFVVTNGRQVPTAVPVFDQHVD
jgi:hypothetical protein